MIVTAPPARVFVKDPHAVLDYTVDWANWLDDDTISVSSWTAPAGITVDSEESTTTTATVWLSGGSAGASYDLTNEVTTSGGRTDNRTIRVVARER